MEWIASIDTDVFQIERFLPRIDNRTLKKKQQKKKYLNRKYPKEPAAQPDSLQCESVKKGLEIFERRNKELMEEIIEMRKKMHCATKDRDKFETFVKTLQNELEVERINHINQCVTLKEEYKTIVGDRNLWRKIGQDLAVKDHVWLKTCSDQDRVIRALNSTLKERALQNQGNSTPQLNLCLICLENSLDTMFLPCNHLCCCDRCFQKLETKSVCIICRSPSNSTLKVFVCHQ